ncbi:MAG: thiol peroxidase [Kiritimatiellia bacterium]
MATVTLKGHPVHTAGELPVVGKPAPSLGLTTVDLGTYKLADAKGSWIVLNIFPSIDTPTCATSVRHFNQNVTRKSGTIVLCISMDLPFAQARFCGAEGIQNVKTLSAFRSPAFGRDYGVQITDSVLTGLLARAVVVIDPSGIVRHTQLVPEIANEPDYAAALAAVQA